MKVHLIRKSSINEFVKSNARSGSSFNQFLSIVKHADWDTPDDIKKTFGKRVDLICNGERVVFDIGGNKFRLICGIKFINKGVFLFVKFIGTHSEYDKLCNVSKGETGICDVNNYK